MSDVGPYGVTQHADAAMVTADQLVGDRVGGTTRENAGVSWAGPALHSTAPYVPPVPSPGPKGCWGKEGTCRAPAITDTRFCYFHSQEIS